MVAGRSYSTSRLGVASEVRGRGREELFHTRGDREDQPHTQGHGRRLGGPTPLQGVMAARVQEGLEALSHIEGQEGQR